MQYKQKLNEVFQLLQPSLARSHRQYYILLFFCRQAVTVTNSNLYNHFQINFFYVRAFRCFLASSASGQSFSSLRQQTEVGHSKLHFACLCADWNSHSESHFFGAVVAKPISRRCLERISLVKQMLLCFSARHYESKWDSL